MSSAGRLSEKRVGIKMAVYRIIYSIIVFAVIAAIVAYFCVRDKRKTLKGKESAFAGVCWLFLFAAGLTAGLTYNLVDAKVVGREVSDPLSAVAEAFSSSIGSFGFNFKFGEIVSAFFGKGFDGSVYAVAVFLDFIFAGVWTYYIIVTTFFRGIISAVKVWINGRICFGTHYIVVGSGRCAAVFLKNLKKDMKRGLFGDRVTVLTGRPKDKNVEQSYKKYVEEGFAAMLGEVDAASLKKAGVRKRAKGVMVVSLSEDDAENIAVAKLMSEFIAERIKKEYSPDTDTDEFLSNALKLVTSNKEKDKDEKSKLIEKISSVRVEARIAYGTIDRAEHFAFAENAFGKVNFFDIYELRARKFFFEHPVTDYIGKFIDVEKARLSGTVGADGKIRKNGKEYVFKNIFIGFGSVNYRMLKSSVISGQVLGADYHAIVYDKGIPEKGKENFGFGSEGFVNHLRFRHQAPGLFGNLESVKGLDYFEDPKENYDIRFRHGDVLAEGFYDGLTKEIKESDFCAVYIALGEDKPDVETAMELRQALASENVDFDKVRIFVKVNEKTSFTSDAVVNSKQGIPLKIECFGYDEDVLTTSEVVAMWLDRLAFTLSNQNHDIPWYLIQESKKDSNRLKVLNMRVMAGFLGMDIVDAADERQAADNEYLERYGLTDDEVGKIMALDVKGDKNNRLKYVVRSKGKAADTARNNLARLEHLRWNASYVANGWTKKPIGLVGSQGTEDVLKKYFSPERTQFDLGRSNTLTKQHACITTFEGLEKLRERQFEVFEEKRKQGKLEKSEENIVLGSYDTIYYDFGFMDKLTERLADLDCAVEKAKTEKASKDFVKYKLVVKRD